MTDSSPINIVLPSQWLIPSEKIGSFKTKTMVDLYSPNPDKFASIIDDYVENSNKTKSKQQAVELGFNHFSAENLKDKYLEIING